MTAPSWTTAAQEWYERWLDKWAKDLKTYYWLDGSGNCTERRAFDDDEIPHMIAWYAERPLEFVQWQEPLEREFYPASYDTYNFDDFFSDRPCWVIDWDKLKGARGRACEAAREAIRLERVRQHEQQAAELLQAEAEQFPTLDAWLAGLGSGHVPQRDWHYVPDECGAATLLDRHRAARLLATRRRLRARWPRLCKGCGREFIVPAHGSNARRCPTCRTQGKQVNA